MHSLIITSLVALGSCKAHNLTEPISSHNSRVLFLDNSLTYTNDLPGVFRDLATAGGFDVGVSSVALPNTALVDYLSRADVLAVVDQGWNYVVMQQGTTSVPVCRDTLVLAARLLASRIRAKGGAPAVMMSWPSSDRHSLFPAVHDSFALAAQTVDGLFLPVGDAWLEAWKLNPHLRCAVVMPADYFIIAGASHFRNYNPLFGSAPTINGVVVGCTDPPAGSSVMASAVTPVVAVGISMPHTNPR